MAIWEDVGAGPVAGDVLKLGMFREEYVVTRIQNDGSDDLIASVNKLVKTSPTVVSELGTRIIMCSHVVGSGVQVVHDRDGNPVLSVMDGQGGRVDVVLSQREALSVAEALVVAAKPGSAEKALYTDPKAVAERILGDLERRTGRGAIDAVGEACDEDDA